MIGIDTMKDRAPANAVDGDAVDEVRLSGRLPGAYGAGEEAQAIRLNSRITKPSDVDSNVAARVRWQESYGALWKLKVAFDKKHNG